MKDHMEHRDRLRVHQVAAAIAVSALATAGFSQMVSYECDSFPAEEGWERIIRSHPPDRWLDGGRLFFLCEVFAPESCVGEDEFYRWSLADWDGVQRFKLEWSAVTDGPRSEILDVAPVSCVASGQRGVLFHTTLANDQVRFLDSVLDPHWLDIQPGVHVFSLDVYGEYWYEWSIDGEVRVAKRPEKQWPTADSVIQWGARAACFDSVSAFDYVRFGVPDDEPVIDCDAVRRLRANCREGRGGEGKIVAKVRTRLDEGTELTLTNNGDHRPLVIDDRGREKAKYKHQSGDHTVLLLNCPAISQQVTCE